MMTMNRLGFGLGLLATFAATAAAAQPAGEPTGLPIIGAPTPGGVNYQPASSPVAHDMHWLSGMVHWIMLVIVLFVVALIADRHRPLQQPLEPEPGALDPQHPDRDRLDAGAGGDPDRDRLLLAAGAVQAARGAAAPT